MFGDDDDEDYAASRQFVINDNEVVYIEVTVAQLPNAVAWWLKKSMAQQKLPGDGRRRHETGTLD